ncbi:hypothetical protein [Methanoregula sp.]|uniref:hypothetical protein n=1 Tax=Methanoregula sp. TaxID=2052170 RepID=UPI002C8BC112|nr:hypothetical protein [Methanoregula sp.]HVP96039.1 hypothetical protein [Methanoregula sp.]
MEHLRKIGIIIGLVLLSLALLLITAHITHASDTSACTRCAAANQSVTPPVTPGTVPQTPVANCTGSETCPLPSIPGTP